MEPSAVAPAGDHPAMVPWSMEEGHVIYLHATEGEVLTPTRVERIKRHIRDVVGTPRNGQHFRIPPGAFEEGL